MMKFYFHPHLAGALNGFKHTFLFLMDDSHTRRGQPCWFRLPQIGMIAVNDGIVLRNHIPRILKKYFRGKPYYVDLLDLFNEVEFQTASGQMIDLITTIEGEKDLTKYSLPLHRYIVQYKTAYYSFYLPVACALLMAGKNLDDHMDIKNILIEMGIYFQVQYQKEGSLEIHLSCSFCTWNNEPKFEQRKHHEPDRGSDSSPGSGSGITRQNRYDS